MNRTQAAVKHTLQIAPEEKRAIEHPRARATSGRGER